MIALAEALKPNRPVLDYVRAVGQGCEAVLPVRPSEHADIGALAWSRGSDPRLCPSPFVLIMAGLKEGLIPLEAAFSAPDGKTPIEGGAFTVRSIRVRANAVIGGATVQGVKEAIVSLGGTPETLNFTSVNVTAVGRHSLVLQWEFTSTSTEQWEIFAVSHHVVYCVLQECTQPWDKNENPPWQTCLDRACSWASGAKTAAEAASLIVEYIYRLGGTSSGNSGTIEYDMSGSANYCTETKFELGAFLDLLEGRPQRGDSFNCSDCASIVSTFANALGCDLEQVKLIPPSHYLETNMVWLLGRPQPEELGAEHRFSMHEVAWSGQTDETGLVYDACLLLDMSADPTSTSYGKVWRGIGGLPLGISDQLPSSYLNRMLKPGARAITLKKMSRRSI